MKHLTEICAVLLLAGCATTTDGFFASANCRAQHHDCSAAGNSGNCQSSQKFCGDKWGSTFWSNILFGL